jgi:NADPH2:quinone reductase
LPAEVPFEIGSAFFSPCTSAWIAVHSIAEVRPGSRVVVTGVTGAVGAMAAQLAQEIGAQVTGTVSHSDRLDGLPAGITGVVVGRGSDHDGSLAEGLEADTLIDTVGGDVLAAVLPGVRMGGRAVLVGYLAGHALHIDLPTFMQRDVSLHPLNMIRRESEGRAVAGELLARLGDGRLHLDVTTFALDQAAAALEWLITPGHRGRAVLLP